MRYCWQQVVLCAAALAVPCAAQAVGEQAALGGEASSKAEAALLDEQGFQRLLESVLPRTGSFIAVYEPVKAKAYGRTTIGFDAATGAWFRAGWAGDSAATGRDPQGFGFVTAARKDSGRPHEPWPPSPLPAATYFPSATLYYLAAHAEAIRSVQHGLDGNWVISWELPAGSAKMFPTQVLVVSADGLLSKRWQEDPNDRREESFEFAPDSPSGFPILASRAAPSPAAPRGGTALAHIEFFSKGNPGLFSQESVAEICYDNSVIVQMKERAQAAGLSGDNDPASSQGSPVVSFTGRQWSRLRWPLVFSGAILVVLAMIEMYRRRSA